MMPKIFVSYRRKGSEAVTGRIVDRLISHYGEESIFIDIDDIPIGADFRQHINEVLQQCDIMIAVIGPRWAGSAKKGGVNIQHENDWVRLEIETALKREVLIIPTLVEGAMMPKALDLPASLKDFAYRNAATVGGGKDFNTHVQQLIRSIDLSVAARKSPAENVQGLSTSTHSQAVEIEMPPQQLVMPEAPVSDWPAAGNATRPAISDRQELGAGSTAPEPAKASAGDRIWKRRIIDYARVAATVWLLAFPLISGARPAEEFYSPLRWVSDIIRFVGGFLPGFFGTWIDGYARSPVVFFLLSGLIVGLTVSRPDNWINKLRDRLRDKLRGSRFYAEFHVAMKRRWLRVLVTVLFVCFSVAAANRLLYNIQDVSGLTCKESNNATGLARDPGTPRPVGESRTVQFNTSDFCKATGIFLERNTVYHVELQATVPWTNAGVPVPEGGFSSKYPPVWYHRLWLGLGVPLRRELTLDWFRVVLRYGGVGGEEVSLDPDPYNDKIQGNIRPTRDGELFVFVNDAVIGIPGLYDFFYRNNTGAAKLTITRK